MKIAFITLGCKLNYAETSTYERGFIAAGWEAVPWREKADIYLVNTCSVTATSDSKSRNVIRKVHRVNPDARIVVTGCSAQLRRAEIERIEGVWRVFGACEKQNVVRETIAGAAQKGGAVAAPSQKGLPVAAPVQRGGPIGLQAQEGGLECPGGKACSVECVGSKGSTVFGAYSSGERTRSFLKVQDGCSNYCKYCTVPFARGESRNIPIAEAVHYAREIAALGVKEVVLTGVNTGDFGRTTGESFPDLLKALNDVDGIERWRISSIEPNLLTEPLIDWLASGTKFQPHFHIPLQAGTDELLSSMGRRYDTALYASRLEYIRRAFEGPGKSKVFFGIDVMAGIPGETPELFERGCEFIRSVRPAFIHVFPYSRRPGTPAATMPGQVPESEKNRRVAVLEDISAELHAAFIEANRGIRERVLFESSCKGGKMEGYTGNYIRVERPYDAALAGKLVDVII